MNLATSNWKESIQEEFEQACEDGNITKAHSLIDYVQFEGFKTMSENMKETLKQQSWYCLHCDSSGENCPHCQDLEETEINDRELINGNYVME